MHTEFSHTDMWQENIQKDEYMSLCVDEATSIEADLGGFILLKVKEKLPCIELELQF